MLTPRPKPPPLATVQMWKEILGKIRPEPAEGVSGIEGETRGVLPATKHASRREGADIGDAVKELSSVVFVLSPGSWEMAKSRNPYHQDDGSRVVRPSVVVWLDILGFREMARAAHRDGTENEFRFSLVCTPGLSGVEIGGWNRTNLTRKTNTLSKLSQTT